MAIVRFINNPKKTQRFRENKFDGLYSHKSSTLSENFKKLSKGDFQNFNDDKIPTQDFQSTSI